MDSTFLIFALILACGAVALLVLAKHHRQQTRILDRATRAIADCGPGPVKIEGTVEAKETFVSAVSDRRCIYMRIAIRQAGLPGLSGTIIPDQRPHLGAGSGRHGSVQTVSEEMVHEHKADSLTLTDASGEVEVDLGDVDFELIQDRALKTSLLGPDDPEVGRILRRFSIKTGAGGGSYTVHETILEPGDRVVVAGHLLVDGSGRTRVAAIDGEPVFITDRDPTQLSSGSRKRAFWASLGAVALGALAAWMLVLGFMSGSHKNPYTAANAGLHELER